MQYSSAERNSRTPYREPRTLLFSIVAFVVPMLVMGLVTLKLSPALLLFGAVFIGVIIATIYWPENATLLVIFMLYANLAVVGIRYNHVPEFAAYLPFLFLLVPFVSYVLLERNRIVIDVVLVAMLVYSVVLLLSALFSERVEDAFGRILVFATEGLILYFLLLNTIRNRRQLLKVIWVLIIAGAFMSVFSVYQAVMGEWDNQFGGLAQLDDGVVSTGDTDWSGNAVTKPVISGTLGEKNHYAKILLLLLPFSTAFVLFAKKRRQRYFAALCSVPICGAMLLTYSRGAFLAAVLMVFGMVVFSWLRLRTVMFASGFMLVVLVLLLPSYVYRISTLSRVAGLSGGYVTRTDSSVSRRAAENMAAIRIFKDYPILGVGPGQTKYYTNHYGQGFGRIAGTRMAHNLYLSTLSDLGLTGFMAFMAVLLIAVFRVWRARLQNSSPDLLIMGSAILLSIGVYMVCSVFLDLGYERYYWLLLALAGAYVQIVRKEDAPESARIAVATS